MPDPGSGSVVAGVADALKWMWDNRGWIGQQLAALGSWWHASDKRPILVLGPGGCGKTTLLRILAGHRDWLTETPWVYSESTGQEKMPLEDDPHVQVVVTPGQPHRAKTYWQDIQADVGAGKYRGVVLLTAYGYHTLGRGMRVRNHPLYKAGVRQPMDDFLTRYLPDRRADELRVLRQLVPHLTACQKQVWLLTVVAKQDLWVGEQQAVEEFYRTGEYGTEVANLVAGKYPAKFRPELAFASLIIANFVGSAGDLIKKNAEGYDHKAQVESVRRLVEVVYGLKEWEAGT